jgi:sugar lactone lactonase YvrE
MPWINWYDENFNTAPTGKIVGYDFWQYAFVNNQPNDSIESGYISTKYAATGNALSCETAKTFVPADLVRTVVGTGITTPINNGVPAIAANLQFPSGITFGATGDMYFCDSWHFAIRKVDASTGLISVVAGTPGVQGFSGDGGPAVSARIRYTYTIAIGPSGHLYFDDSNNYRIRKVDINTGIISTVVGTGTSAWNGDGLPATGTNIGTVWGIDFDSLGNLYFTDANHARVRRVSAITGLVSTVAGNGFSMYNGDGIPATGASLNNPIHVTLDAADNVYICDASSHRVRKVDAITGLISTVVGTGIAGYNGDGILATTAQVSYPRQSLVDGAGNIYITDTSNIRIRKVNASTGRISTITGTGVGGYNGENIVATTSKTNNAWGLAINPVNGLFYFTDQQNNRIRQIYPGLTPSSDDHIERFSRGLGSVRGNYEMQFKMTYHAPLPTTGVIPVDNGVYVMGLLGNALQTNWTLRFNHLQTVSLADPALGTFNLGTFDFATSGQVVRVSEDNDGILRVYLPNVSATPVFTSAARPTEFRALDRMGIVLNSTTVTPLYTSIDDIALRYFIAPTAAAIVPKAPQNPWVNARENYSVLSWDPVTTGIVTDSTLRGASGWVDGLACSGLTTSPIVTSAVIDATTIKDTASLPKEGEDFAIDRATGIITWSSDSDAIVPDANTIYWTTYEIPISDVTTYRVYKSSLLNEYDGQLYKSVTGLDFNGVLDTAFVDAAPGDVAAYRVASVDSSMVESELSGKVVATKISTQADDKTEVVDRKLFTLDQSLLDEGLIR